MCDDNGVMDPAHWDLFQKLVDGVPIVNSEPEPYVCSNYKSILEPENMAKMDKIVKSEVSEGMISLAGKPPTCVHALGAVAKPNGNIRSITDCSRPVGVSVNYHGSALVEKFHYLSVDDVTDLLLPNDFMATVDIKAAYRAVLIDPAHRQFMGFRWEIDGVSHEFVDNRLCFGLRSGPAYFNSISTFLATYLRQVHGLYIVQYLDDFLCLDRTYEKCVVAQNCIIDLLRFVGFYISWSKIQPPSQVLTFLGIELDSIKMELRLPPGKLVKLRDVLEKHKSATYISKKDLEVLTGLLAHCSTIGVFMTYISYCVTDN